MDVTPQSTQATLVEDLAPGRAMSIRRRFTQPGVHPFDSVEWELRDARIGHGDKVAFEQLGVEFPITWSQNSTNIVAQKYFRGQVDSPARERSVKKEMPQLDEHCIRFIALSPLLVVASHSAGGGGTLPPGGGMDASPRGGEAGFVKVVDANTLLIPDSPGNNRLDTLENIIQTGLVGLLFFVPGVDETLRVNGLATLSTDPDDIAKCLDAKRTPKLVIRVTVRAAYLHCAKALMRSNLWDATRHIDRTAIPSMGEMMKDQIGDGVPAETQAQMLVRYAVDL